MPRVLDCPVLDPYRAEALQQAEYNRLEDGSRFADIPGFAGVWANRGTLEATRTELAEVLREWLLLKFRDGDALPTVWVSSS